MQIPGVDCSKVGFDVPFSFAVRASSRHTDLSADLTADFTPAETPAFRKLGGIAVGQRAFLCPSKRAFWSTLCTPICCQIQLGVTRSPPRTSVSTGAISCLLATLFIYQSSESSLLLAQVGHPNDATRSLKF